MATKSTILPYINVLHEVSKVLVPEIAIADLDQIDGYWFDHRITFNPVLRKGATYGEFRYYIALRNSVFERACLLNHIFPNRLAPGMMTTSFLFACFCTAQVRYWPEHVAGKIADISPEIFSQDTWMNAFHRMVDWESAKALSLLVHFESQHEKLAFIAEVSVAAEAHRGQAQQH